MDQTTMRSIAITSDLLSTHIPLDYTNLKKSKPQGNINKFLIKSTSGTKSFKNLQLLTQQVTMNKYDGFMSYRSPQNKSQEPLYRVIENINSYDRF
jgi:hypothetical protein